MRKLREILSPSLTGELIDALDRQSLRNTCNVTLAVFIFESLSVLIFMPIEGWKLEGSTLASLLSVSFCALFSLAAFLISRRLKRRQDLPHWKALAFKAALYIIYTVWAIHVDMRHYAAGDQMLTFFAVQLMMVSFVMLTPWISVLLTFGAYAGLYAAALFARGGDGIDLVNYIILAVLSIVGMYIRYETQLYLARKEERLKNEALVLEKYMRQDPLTGLQNRLALEEYARETDGSPLSAYMTDVNYFKEINDRYGHLTGDSILKEIGEILRRLYPGARYYRYGGDEFLVLSGKAPEENYAEIFYRFQQQNGADAFEVTLSIGCAAGAPGTYEELFELISRADAALYTVKKRLHSPEFGGHDRRRSRSSDGNAGK